MAEQATLSGATPIDCLSAELFYRIFLDLRDGWVDDQKRRIVYPNSRIWDWITITHVCRYWRASALGFASLWTKILNFQSTEKVNAFLDRSSMASLEVFTKICYGESTSADRKLHSLICALEQSHRIYRIHIDISFEFCQKGYFDQIQSLLSRPLPQLQKLEFSVSQSPGLPNHRQVEVSASLRSLFENPSLKSVTLKNLTCLPVIPTDLLELSLSSIQHISFMSFLKALIYCPDLEVLIIEGVLWSVEDSPELLSLLTSGISLPKLSRLTMSFGEKNKAGNEDLPKILRIPVTTNCSCNYAIGHFKTQPLHITTLFANFAKETLLCRKLLINIYSKGFRIEIHYVNTQNNSAIMSRMQSFCSNFTPLERVVGYVASLVEARSWRSAEEVAMGR